MYKLWRCLTILLAIIALSSCAPKVDFQKTFAPVAAQNSQLKVLDLGTFYDRHESFDSSYSRYNLHRMRIWDEHNSFLSKIKKSKYFRVIQGNKKYNLTDAKAILTLRSNFDSISSDARKNGFDYIAFTSFKIYPMGSYDKVCVHFFSLRDKKELKGCYQHSYLCFSGQPHHIRMAFNGAKNDLLDTLVPNIKSNLASQK